MAKQKDVLHFDAKTIALILLGIFICLLSLFLVASVLVASHGMAVTLVALLGHALIHFLTAQAAVDIFMLAAAGGLSLSIATVIIVKFINFINHYIVQPFKEWWYKKKSVRFDNNINSPEKKKDKKKRSSLPFGGNSKKSNEESRLFDDQTETPVINTSGYAQISTQMQTTSASSSSTTGLNQFDNEAIFGKQDANKGVTVTSTEGKGKGKEKKKERSTIGKARHAVTQFFSKKDKSKGKEKDKKEKPVSAPSSILTNTSPS